MFINYYNKLNSKIGCKIKINEYNGKSSGDS